MKIKGNHSIDVTLKELWPLLQDPIVLARIAPGIKKLELIGDDHYKAISEISIGPVRGSFEGELELTDKVDYETMTLQLDQKSKMGNAKASVIMNLLTLDGVTQISYNGTAKVSGRLATMGQRILGGVVTTLSKQVFKELDAIVDERKIASRQSQSSHSAEAEEVRKKSFIKYIIDKIKELWK